MSRSPGRSEGDVSITSSQNLICPRISFLRRQCRDSVCEALRGGLHGDLLLRLGLAVQGHGQPRLGLVAELLGERLAFLAELLDLGDRLQLWLREGFSAKAARGDVPNRICLRLVVRDGLL